MNIGRKAWMAWASFFACNIALHTDKIQGGEYVTLMTLMFGLYAGANVLGKKK